jgi:iron complex outermembrane receptor protein
MRLFLVVGALIVASAFAHAAEDVTGLSGAGADPAPAGDNSTPGSSLRPSGGIEEIIVTARRREENVRQVPLAISVIDGRFVENESLTDFRDLALFAPNTRVDNNPIFPDIRIRGFGSPLSNKGFEQPVGLVLDGVPYGRASYYTAPMFDLQRVEVLRGPQGTLFGKNTTAGVFNVVTANPTEDLEGRIDLDYGELDRRRFEGAVGGPVLRGVLDLRIAALSESRDGFMKNTTAEFVSGANSHMNDRDRSAVRVKLGLPDLLGASVVVSYEHVALNQKGVGWELRIVQPRLVPFLRQFDPNVDLVPNNYVGSVDRSEFTSIDTDTFVANATLPLGAWTIDAVAGHSVLKNRIDIDDDFTPAPVFFNTSFDSNPSTTFELKATAKSLSGLLGLARFFGWSLGSTEIVGGFFYQRRAIDDSTLGLGVHVPTLLALLAAQGFLPNPVQPIGPLAPNGVFLPIDRLNTGALVPFASRETTEVSTGFYQQTGDTVAGFGDVDWHFADRWTLESGMRATEEWKNADVSRRCTEGTCLVLSTATAIRDFSRHLHRAEFAFTPRESLRFAWNDAADLYASWALGYKAGGFNELSLDGSSDGLEFGPERAESWEVGAKLLLLDGSAMANLALFREDVHDLQVFTLEPPTYAARAVNAGKARSQGVEADLGWQLTRWISVVGSIGFDDAKFLRFPFGSCTQDRPNTDGDADPRCDQSGQPLYHTPKWTSMVTPNVRVPLGSIPFLGITPGWLGAIDGIGSFTVDYQDTHFTSITNDPRTRQPSFVRFGARLGLADDRYGWSCGVAVENLTAVASAAQSLEVPEAPGNFVQLPEPPRLLFGYVRWRF